jgi:hypothetical protein
VQVIHNAADVAANSVAVWAGLPGSPVFLPAIPNFGFRTATPALTGLGAAIPFFSDAVGVPLMVNVTDPNAAAASPALSSIQLSLGVGANIVIANGNVRPRLLAPNPDNISTAFNLVQFVDRQTVSSSTVRLLIFHGATDAPRVDVVARGVGTLATASYGQGAFVNVPVGNYIIDIRPAGSQTVVASFSAPLAALNLGGQRVSVLASGFLNPVANQAGAPFGLFAVVNSLATNVVATMLPTTAAPTSATTPTRNNSISNLSISPNPTVESAILTYELSEAGAVNVDVYNTYGQIVSTVEKATKIAGTYSVNIPVSSLQSGMYECRVSQASGTKSTRLMVVR